jgi:hypothetical protein
VTAHVMVNTAEAVKGGHVRVSHRLHLGYTVSRSDQCICASKRLVALIYRIDGLKKVRLYDIALEPEERILPTPPDLPS